MFFFFLDLWEDVVILTDDLAINNDGILEFYSQGSLPNIDPSSVTGNNIHLANVIFSVHSSVTNGEFLNVLELIAKTMTDVSSVDFGKNIPGQIVDCRGKNSFGSITVVEDSPVDYFMSKFSLCSSIFHILYNIELLKIFLRLDAF